MLGHPPHGAVGFVGGKRCPASTQANLRNRLPLGLTWFPSPRSPAAGVVRRAWADACVVAFDWIKADQVRVPKGVAADEPELEDFRRPQSTIDRSHREFSTVPVDPWYPSITERNTLHFQPWCRNQGLKKWA